ncbi:MAG: TrmH family RNA methyltransferase [Candidatus Giovannonibacteria bacterium]|nr:TrmH family RNA methyltransferase [Candidatus Giovannonibacteria bacterium]
MKIFLILHNVRSLHNVGSIFRTAEGLGVKKIYLTGYTPEPYDIFGKLRKDFQKTALGAEKYLEWKQVKNIFALIKRLKQDGVKIVALEQSKSSINIKKFKPRAKFALILGNEVTGIPKSVLKKCDKIIEIPMRGKKESLNVSVAAGIALYALRNLDVGRLSETSK